MTDILLNEPVLIAAASLIGLLIVANATLRGWHGWLALKERELDRLQPAACDGPTFPGAARIELADLRERVRKLEAIASGVDL